MTITTRSQARHLKDRLLLDVQGRQRHHDEAEQHDVQAVSAHGAKKRHRGIRRQSLSEHSPVAPQGAEHVHEQHEVEGSLERARWHNITSDGMGAGRREGVERTKRLKWGGRSLGCII